MNARFLPVLCLSFARIIVISVAAIMHYFQHFIIFRAIILEWRTTEIGIAHRGNFFTHDNNGLVNLRYNRHVKR